jgi:hypothetical protein
MEERPEEGKIGNGKNGKNDQILSQNIRAYEDNN